MKKALKIIGYILITLIILVSIAFFTFNEKLPTGVKGNKAEALAQKMMAAVNKSAWDATNIIGWTYAINHNYVWDKKRNFIQVEWDKHKALINLTNLSGKVWENQEPVTDPAKVDKLIKEAHKYFINDAFWLNPVVKIYDAGVERSLVTLADGTEGLLVSYTSGGLTPGDSYLWKVNEQGMPTAWKLWVKVLPIGGIEISWDDWVTLTTGAKVSTKHIVKALGTAIPLINLKVADNLIAFGLSEDVFQGI